MRAISFEDEIKMHAVLWTACEEFKKLPPSLQADLTRLLCDLKVSEATRDSVSEAPKNDSSVFIAVFLRKYHEFTSVAYEIPVTPKDRFMLRELCEKLREVGSEPVHYIEWFFDEYIGGNEFLKARYRNPGLPLLTSSAILQEFKVRKADELRRRKIDTEQFSMKNAILTLAAEYLERAKDKKIFGEKVKKFQEGGLSVMKFSDIFAAVLTTAKETSLLSKLTQITGEKNG